jgi:hypothetical protein
MLAGEGSMAREISSTFAAPQQEQKKGERTVFTRVSGMAFYALKYVSFLYIC